MKRLKDYKEVIHKCSKCGLCQSVCPVYLETGNECTVSRGQFIMLQGVIKGDLKINKNINKYLDTCLKCGKCSDFCPSDIDIVEVILSAKAEYFKHSLRGKVLSFLQSKMVFNTALKLIRGVFGRQKKFKKTFTKKAIYFGGCVEAVFPKTSEYIKELLNLMEIEVVDKKFDCCGLPFLTSGNIERFIEQGNENAEKIKGIDFDYFVTDCASCMWAWQEYAKYIDDEELKEKLQNIKFVSIYDLIEEYGLMFETVKSRVITYHTPCHGSAEGVISRIRNVEYRELEGKNDCCGFGAISESGGMLKGLISRKRDNIFKTGADYVLTNCAGCLIALNYSLRFKKKVIRVIDFLRKYCEVSK